MSLPLARPARLAARVLLLAGLGALPRPAWGVDILTPVIGVGDCAITGISSATPAVVSVLNRANCGLNDNGTVIWVWGAQNTGTTGTYSSINGHLENAADTNGMCRVAKNFSGNSFRVYACDGTTPLTNNGVYRHGGRVAKGQWRTRKDLPVIDYDGAGGSLDTCIQSSAPGGCYEPGRMERVALDAVSATLPDLSVKHADPVGTWTSHAALRWAAEGKPASGAFRDKMRQGLINNHPAPTVACDLSVADCGYGVSGYADYAVEVYLGPWIRNYNLGLSQLTPAELHTLSEYLISDYAWQKGGHNYAGTNLTFPAFKPVSGTVTWSEGSNVVTGTGTLFTTEVQVGDFILIGNSAYPRWFPVVAITSDTALSLGRAVPPGSETGAAQPYKVGRAWLEGTDVGFLAWSHQDYYSTLCNPGYPAATGCPDYSNLGAGGFQAWHNHNMGRMVNPALLAVTFAHVDPRWNWLATDALFQWYHRFQPGPWRSIGGISHAASGYHYLRILPYITSMVGGLRNSFTDSPDYLGDNEPASAAWWDEIAALQLTDFKPGRGIEPFQTGGEPGDTPCCAAAANAGLAANLFQPGNSLAAAVKHHLEVDSGLYSAAQLTSSGNGGQTSGDTIGFAYIANRPSITPVRSTQTSFFTRAALSGTCQSIWTTAACSPDRRFFLASRAGLSAAGAWDSSSFLMRYDFSSTGVWDHDGQQHSVGPQISANGKNLIAGDGLYGGFNAIPGSNIFVLGSEANFKAGNSFDPYGANGFGISTPIFALTQPDLAAAGVDTTSHYKTASGVTSATRTVVHAKAGGLGFVIERDDFTATAPLTASTYTHYWIGDANCGTPAASPCITLNRAAGAISHVQNNGTFARIDTQFYGGAVDTVNHSDTDGSYPTQSGRTFRVTNSVTGTEGSLFAVHQVTTADGSTMPPIDEATVGAFKKIEIKSAANPVVALLAPAKTLNLTGVGAFDTSHAATAQYVITGLAAGTYIPRRNGIDLSAPVTVTPAAHILVFSSTAGTISVVPGPPPLSIVTQTLPNAVLGKTYSVSLTGNSSTMPYSWDIQSGSLCAGLTLTPGSPSAVIAGTAQNIETCTFTVRVQNSDFTETFSRQYTIKAVPAGAGTVAFLNTQLPAARVLDPYSVHLLAAGGTVPYTWTISSGTLCNGLSLDPSTGLLSGAVPAEGSCAFTLRVTDLGNEFDERSLTIVAIPDRQSTLEVSAAASYSAAVVRLGQRGLPFDQACTVAFRLGGSGGPVTQTLTSVSGPSRRELVATGLAAGLPYHLTAECGGAPAEATFETGFAPSSVQPVTLHLQRPTLNGAPAEVAVAFGATAEVPNLMVLPCTASECTAIIDTADPLLYWRAHYRDGSGNTLAQTDLRVIAPR